MPSNSASSHTRNTALVSHWHLCLSPLHLSCVHNTVAWVVLTLLKSKCHHVSISQRLPIELRKNHAVTNDNGGPQIHLPPSCPSPSSSAPPSSSSAAFWILHTHYCPRIFAPATSWNGKTLPSDCGRASPSLSLYKHVFFACPPQTTKIKTNLLSTHLLYSVPYFS